MRTYTLPLACAVLTLAGALTAAAQGPQPLRLTLTPFATGLSLPVDLTAAPADPTHLYVVEKAGRIRRFDTSGVAAATPFLDIRARVGSTAGEQGLLGLAFAPDYATTGHFFVNYTNLTGDTRISRFTRGATADAADPASELVIYSAAQPFSNHNGGCVKFGPDGYLYCALGDGGSGGDPGNRAQNLGSPLGKILRFDVRAATAAVPFVVPPSNPLIGVAGALPEIWAWGLRNPWRFSIDAVTGDVWIGDVGQGLWEEVDMVPATMSNNQLNFGWRCYEGAHAYNVSGACGPMSDYRAPVFEYDHSQGQSITGGFVYRGARYPTLVGRYVVADYSSGKLWTLAPDATGVGFIGTPNLTTQNGLVAFGEDSRRELYAADINTGRILRVGATGGTPLPTGLSTDAVAAALQVFPNPATSQCRVVLPAGMSGSVTVEVLSLVTGQLLHQAVLTAAAGETTLDVSGLAAGLYAVRAVGGARQTATARLAVSR